MGLFLALPKKLPTHEHIHDFFNKIYSNIKNTQGFVFALRKTEGNPVLGSFMHTVHCMISRVPSIQCMNFTFQYLYDKTTNTLKFPSHPRAK